MKRILYTVISFCVILSSCERMDLRVGAPAGGVTLEASVVGAAASAATKATGDLSPVRVLAFDELGYLVEQSEAYGFTYGAGEDGKETRFSVDLTATSEFRRLHFIAGYDIGAVAFGKEAQLIGALDTDNGNVAYWQYVDLPDGISEEMDMSVVTRLPLVRNIAQVSVESTDAAFTLYGFKVVNIPSVGGVAAWMAGTGPFAGYRSESAPDYATLNAAGYHGMTAIGGDVLTSSGWTTDPVTVYEHPYTGDAATYTYILLHGQLDGVDHESYYKIDLVRTLGDGTNEYLDILRNINYSVTIESMGSVGYRTEAEAVSHPAGNNVSGSVDTESLDNISDGRGQLFVSDTDIIIVDNDAVTLRYRFIPDVVEAPTVTSNGSVTVTAPAGDVLESAAAVAGSDAADGWRTVTLTPRANDGETRTQTIRLSTASGLTKNIRLRRRPRYTLSVAVSPLSVDQVINTPVTVTVTLPEGLPASVFPLTMMVSSDDGTVYPDPAGSPMPVLFGEGTYGYRLDVERSEYLASDGVFTCTLLTNKVKSATTVRVSNKYFNTAGAAFGNNPRYVTSFTIPAKSMIITGLSSQYNSFQLYYDSARKSRINNTSYRLYAYGPENATTITVNSMLSTDLIYFYNTTRRTTVGMSIEDLEEGGHTLATY